MLLGDPAYYGRFGFVLAERLGILAPDPSWAAHFQVRPLSATALVAGRTPSGPSPRDGRPAIAAGCT